MVQTGSQLGPYRLQRRIGAGGMAEVFLGQRIGAEGFARTVAIKTILAVGAEEEGIGLFLDEARVASYLEHAAIVQTVDLGFENETLFIVMEYVPGPALSRMIRDLKKLNRFLSPQVVAYVGSRVASALDYAWSRAGTPDGKVLRLVHRDISPQNILITRTGNVKLTDFGVARASVQTHKTRTGQVRGKAAYMAPEQVRAGALDGRTDVFALALVLYEALTGVRAFQRKTDIMSMRAILTDEVQPIKEINPAVPDDLIAVLRKACAKKPDERYQTAAELGEALQKTYRAHSEAAIEAEIVALINELFGPEQFGSEQGVEAWQPTIAANAEQAGGSHPTPHRIAAGRLSPKIAAMLAPQTPPSSPSVETPVDPFDDGADVDLESMVAASPQKTPSGVAFAGTAGAREEHASGAMPGPFTRLGHTQAQAMTAGFNAEPVFGSAPFNELMPGTHVPGANVPPGFLTHVASPSNGTVAPGFNLEPKPRGRALVWGAGVFALAMVGALSVLLVYSDRGAQELEAPVEGAPTAVVGVSPREPAIKATASAGSSTIEPATEQDVAKARERAVTKTPRRERTEQRIEKPEDKPAIEKTAEKAVEKTEEPKRGKNESDETQNKAEKDFVLRALTARKKVDSMPELRAKLTSVINDVMGGREITAEDWELVKKAEQL